MLPEDWKKEIKEAADEAAARNAESDKARIASQNAIATPLERLANEFGGYKSEYGTTERKKSGREIATIFGLYLNAFLVFMTAIIFYGQLRVSQSSDATFKETMITGERAYVIIESAAINNLDKIAPDQGVGISYNIKNIGRTPVYDLRQLLFIGLRRSPIVNYDGIQWSRASDIPYFTNDANVQGLEGPGFTPEVLETIKRASLRIASERLHFIGRVNYRDVFNQDRWTDFCFMYLGGGQSMGLVACDYLNDADVKDKKRRDSIQMEVLRKPQ
jgi:hypothetical protein